MSGGEPIRRLYRSVTLDDGIDLTVYHDLVDEIRFEQRYAEVLKPPLQPSRPARALSMARAPKAWDAMVERVKATLTGGADPVQ
jgi:hypothetical protein